MKILLSNDDGVTAPGIIALAKALEKEHEVMICAPESERSASSHSITFLEPVRAKEIKLQQISGRAYSISGTPADCVKLGLGNLFHDVELVISGINRGSNVGTDIIYSGTVAAAMEGFISGIPAMAVSLEYSEDMDYDFAASAAARVAGYLGDRGTFCCDVLNVNIPAQDRDKIAGVKLTSMGVKRYDARYLDRMDPRGGKYYWMSTEAIRHEENCRDTDVNWLEEGYITLTPLNFNLTDHKAMKSLFDGDICSRLTGRDIFAR